MFEDDVFSHSLLAFLSAHNTLSSYQPEIIKTHDNANTFMENFTCPSLKGSDSICLCLSRMPVESANSYKSETS